MTRPRCLPLTRIERPAAAEQPSQERAARTRQSLVGAAAAAFDNVGYDHASLVAISRAAGVSRGGLSFHFRNKAELADAVQGVALRVTLDSLETVLCGNRGSVQAFIDVSHLLARLLDENVFVRAGARLSSERRHCSQTASYDPRLDWHTSWRQVLEYIGSQLREDGLLRPAAAAVPELLRHVLFGKEMATHLPLQAQGAEPWTDTADRPAPALLTSFWQLVLPQLVTRNTPTDLRVAGSHLVRTTHPSPVAGHPA